VHEQVGITPDRAREVRVGLVHITELGGEYYRFDEVKQELRGERTGVRYVVGARVRVQVSRVDLDGRKIDFRMVRDNDEDAALIRARRERMQGRPNSAVSELEAVKEVDRAVKAATKGKGRSGSSQSANPIRAAKAAARKASAKTPRRR